MQAAKVLQQTNYQNEPNDDNYEVNKRLLNLEAEVWESLPIDAAQDLHITPAVSLASAGCTNVRTTQLVSNENTKPSNQIVFTAEENVECTISDRNATTSRKNKAQEWVPFIKKPAPNANHLPNSKLLKDHDRRFLCDMEGCSLAFTRAYELDRHKKAVHGEGQRFPCPKPGCKFSIHGPKVHLEGKTSSGIISITYILTWIWLPSPGFSSCHVLRSVPLQTNKRQKMSLTHKVQRLHNLAREGTSLSLKAVVWKDKNPQTLK